MVAPPLLDSSSGCACTAISRSGATPSASHVTPVSSDCAVERLSGQERVVKPRIPLGRGFAWSAPGSQTAPTAGWASQRALNHSLAERLEKPKEFRRGELAAKRVH